MALYGTLIIHSLSTRKGRVSICERAESIKREAAHMHASNHIYIFSLFSILLSLARASSLQQEMTLWMLCDKKL